MTTKNTKIAPKPLTGYPLKHVKRFVFNTRRLSFSASNQATAGNQTRGAKLMQQTVVGHNPYLGRQEGLQEGSGFGLRKARGSRPRRVVHDVIRWRRLRRFSCVHEVISCRP